MHPNPNPQPYPTDCFPNTQQTGAKATSNINRVSFLSTKRFTTTNQNRKLNLIRSRNWFTNHNPI
ncbi:hypothetical protein Hanom_Chr01g00064661 [Helianthus anomalus]